MEDRTDRIFTCLSAGKLLFHVLVLVLDECRAFDTGLQGRVVVGIVKVIEVVNSIDYS
jgi:hypothetical protein